MPEPGLNIGLPPLEPKRIPRGGVICKWAWTGCMLRVGGGVAKGPGVVIGCFSTCKALITKASRLWYLEMLENKAWQMMC